MTDERKFPSLLGRDFIERSPYPGISRSASPRVDP